MTAGTLWGTHKGKFDGFVRKLHEGDAGTVVVDWTRQFGTTEDDYIHDLTTDGLGNVYVVGRTLGALTSNVDGGTADGGIGGSDLYLRKMGSDGNYLWTHQFGTTANEQAYGVAVDTSGNVYIAGYSEGDLAAPNAGGADIVLRKVNSSGSHIWTRQFGTTGGDAAYDVVVDSSGNAYIGGWVAGPVGCPKSGGTDGLVRKYDPSGNVVWTHQFGGPYMDQVFSIAQATGGTFVVGGTTHSGVGGSFDAYVHKISASGTSLWMQLINNTVENEYTQGVATSGGFVWAVGYEGKLNNEQAIVAKLAL